MVNILITGAAAILTVVIILTIIALLTPFLMSDLYECYELYERANDSRQKRKGERLQDLNKALYYLQREIQREESKQ